MRLGLNIKRLEYDTDTDLLIAVFEEAAPPGHPDPANFSSARELEVVLSTTNQVIRTPIERLIRE